MKLSRKQRKALKSKGSSDRYTSVPKAPVFESVQEITPSLSVEPQQKEKTPNTIPTPTTAIQANKLTSGTKQDLLLILCIALAVLVIFVILYLVNAKIGFLAGYGETLISKLNIQL